VAGEEPVIDGGRITHRGAAGRSVTVTVTVIVDLDLDLDVVPEADDLAAVLAGDLRAVADA
jgi:hypothetical protein